jgi:hypothetical protein
MFRKEARLIAALMPSCNRAIKDRVEAKRRGKKEQIEAQRAVEPKEAATIAFWPTFWLGLMLAAGKNVATWLIVWWAQYPAVARVQAAGRDVAGTGPSGTAAKPAGGKKT